MTETTPTPLHNVITIDYDRINNLDRIVHDVTPHFYPWMIGVFVRRYPAGRWWRRSRVSEARRTVGLLRRRLDLTNQAESVAG